MNLEKIIPIPFNKKSHLRSRLSRGFAFVATPYLSNTSPICQQLFNPLGSEGFLNGGGKGFSHFFLEFAMIEQAFIFLVGDISHLHQNRRDVRGL